MIPFNPNNVINSNMMPKQRHVIGASQYNSPSSGMSNNPMMGANNNSPMMGSMRMPGGMMGSFNPNPNQHPIGPSSNFGSGQIGQLQYQGNPAINNHSSIWGDSNEPMTTVGDMRGNPIQIPERLKGQIFF